MHILFLTDNFPPEVNAPASRTFEHCRRWVEAGHRVTVVTCAPNFPKGEVFEGYRNRPWQRETMAGIRVIRVWSYIAANQGFARRIADYLSYMFAAILAVPFVSRPDIVVGTSPQFFTACAAYAASRMKRVPFVFELRDLWPESIRAVGAMSNSRLLDWLEHLELFLYRKSDRVVSVTHAFKRDLIARGIDGQKIDVITNGVDMTRFAGCGADDALACRLGLKGKFVAGYIGTHGMAHALETLLDTAAMLQKRADASDVRIVFLGDGASKSSLVERSASMGLKNVVFLDSVAKELMPAYWSLLDVSIIHLRKTELFQSVIPSKLFECMAMGIPVMHGVAGESAEIVEKNAVGVTFEPQNPEALCEGLLRMRADRSQREILSRNGPVAAAGFDRDALAMDMCQVLEKVAGSRGGPRSTCDPA